MIHLLALMITAAALETEAERQQFVANATREQLTQFALSTPPAALLAMSERAINAYGIYTYSMTKQERVGGRAPRVANELIRGGFNCGARLRPDSKKTETS